jgi:hypothetical protein
VFKSYSYWRLLSLDPVEVITDAAVPCPTRLTVHRNQGLPGTSVDFLRTYRTTLHRGKSSVEEQASRGIRTADRSICIFTPFTWPVLLRQHKNGTP